MRLAERIQERLDATGKTARGASLEAGLGPDAIRIILDGRSQSPRMKTIAALAGVLDCDIAYLAGNAEESERAESSKYDCFECGHPLEGPVCPACNTPPTSITVRAGGRVTINIQAEVSVGIAAQILALIEGDCA